MDDTKDERVMCSTGCGFWGSKSQNNLCSKCFRETTAEKGTDGFPVTPASPTPSTPAASSAVTPLAPAAAPTTITTPSPAAEPSSAPSASAAPMEDDEAPKPPKRKKQKNKGRCFACKKRVGLTGFACKCSYVFCGAHRFAEAHDCDFDYKTHEREILAKNNQKLEAAKLERL